MSCDGEGNEIEMPIEVPTPVVHIDAASQATKQSFQCMAWPAQACVQTLPSHLQVFDGFGFEVPNICVHAGATAMFIGYCSSFISRKTNLQSYQFITEQRIDRRRHVQHDNTVR